MSGPSPRCQRSGERESARRVMARVAGNTRRFGRAASAAHSRRPRQLETRLRDVTVLAGRDRIAADLQDKVIQRIFAAGLTVQGGATLTTDPTYCAGSTHRSMTSTMCSGSSGTLSSASGSGCKNEVCVRRSSSCAMTWRQYPRKSSADLSTAPSVQASAARRHCRKVVLLHRGRSHALGPHHRSG